MGRILDFLKNFKKRYDAKLIRDQKMDEFLNDTQDNRIRIENINTSISNLNHSVICIDKKVDALSTEVDGIGQKIKIIGKGTKMELFDTLYHWKKILTDRGWGSPAEKHEVEEIYKIYHDGLGGNGQGEHYYNEIMNLPESEEEMKKNMR